MVGPASAAAPAKHAPLKVTITPGPLLDSPTATALPTLARPRGRRQPVAVAEAPPRGLCLADLGDGLAADGRRRDLDGVASRWRRAAVSARSQ